MQRATISTVASFRASLSPPAPTPPPSFPIDHRRRTHHAAADDDDVQLDVPAGLTAAELDRFNRGRAAFSRVFTDAEDRPVVQRRLRELPRGTRLVEPETTWMKTLRRM
jgi:hypothetical protein